MIGPLIAQQFGLGLSSDAPSLAMRAGKDGRVDLVPVRRGSTFDNAGEDANAAARRLSEVRWKVVALAVVTAVGVLQIVAAVTG